MILVTGAAGFVGRHLVAGLRARGHAVRAHVRGASAPDADDVLRHDLAAGPLPDAAWEHVTAVVHAAAHVPAAPLDPREARACVEINGLSTFAIAEAALARGARIVYLSGNVYAPGATPVTEEAPAWPAHRATPYLASKLLGELFVANAAVRGARTVTLRAANVYGPGIARGVVATFVRRLRAGETVEAGVGPYRADLVEVGDVVAATAACLDRPEACGIYNVGSGRPVGMDDLARGLAAEAGRPDLVREVPQVGADPGFAPLDVGRASRELGFRPTPLADGLHRLWTAA